MCGFTRAARTKRCESRCSRTKLLRITRRFQIGTLPARMGTGVISAPLTMGGVFESMGGLICGMKRNEAGLSRIAAYSQWRERPCVALWMSLRHLEHHNSPSALPTPFRPGWRWHFGPRDLKNDSITTYSSRNGESSKKISRADILRLRFAHQRERGSVSGLHGFAFSACRWHRETGGRANRVLGCLALAASERAVRRAAVPRPNATIDTQTGYTPLKLRVIPGGKVSKPGYAASDIRLGLELPQVRTLLATFRRNTHGVPNSPLNPGSN